MPNELRDVHVLPTREELGKLAAEDIAAHLRERLAEQTVVRVIFAAAPSQSSTMDELVKAGGIDWSRVHAFHMDEYIGLPPDAPERFGNWLKANLFDRLPFGEVHLITIGEDPKADARRYAELLAEAPVDVVCCGIGVNGHLAFNDPPVADFDDPRDVKVVELDEVCRQQQVDDECFEDLASVPTSAITLTVPRLLSAGRIFCIVPGASKAPAVWATMNEPITTAWPSTALRDHAACTFYFDAEAASLL